MGASPTNKTKPCHILQAVLESKEEHPSAGRSHIQTHVLQHAIYLFCFQLSCCCSSTDRVFERQGKRENLSLGMQPESSEPWYVHMFSSTATPANRASPSSVTLYRQADSKFCEFLEVLETHDLWMSYVSNRRILATSKKI